MEYYYILNDKKIELKNWKKTDKYIFSANIQVSEIILPPCKSFRCESIGLKTLIMTSCDVIECTNNPIEKIYIPKNVQKIKLENTKLSEVIINLYKTLDPIKIELANNLQINSSQK
jgi:hypothetical protein